MESEDDLAERLVERLPIEEAEECLRKLEERLITVDVLGIADTQDLADECGFTEQQCDAVLLNDVAWRAKYGKEHAGAPGVQGNADLAVQESQGRLATPARAWGPARVQEWCVRRPTHSSHRFICGHCASSVDALCAAIHCITASSSDASQLWQIRVRRSSGDWQHAWVRGNRQEMHVHLAGSRNSWPHRSAMWHMK